MGASDQFGHGDLLAQSTARQQSRMKTRVTGATAPIERKNPVNSDFCCVEKNAKLRLRAASRPDMHSPERPNGAGARFALRPALILV
jgi:hypothetical protein